MRVQNRSSLMSKILLNEQLLRSNMYERLEIPKDASLNVPKKNELSKEKNELFEILAECYSKMNRKKKVFTFKIMSRA